MTTVLVAGGGTGGHVYPGLAVADAVRVERPGTRVVFVGTGRGIEKKVIPERGDTLELLDVRPLRGGGLGGFVKGALRALAVMPEARALVRRLAPDVVFSLGGYAAGPVTLAAWSLGVPVTLMEPNSVAGFTNRLLRPFIERAYLGFPETREAFDEHVGRFSGVPLRAGFSVVPHPGRARPRLLVMGGSQGAKALNEALPRAFAACRAAGHAFDVVHQTGRDKNVEVEALYAEIGLEAEVVPFIDDVRAALAEADLVIERAGASSCAELCAVGRPAILVPYPYAADDHQRMNAVSLARAGAAICIVQAEATVARLEAELAQLLGDPARLGSMAEAAAERGRPEAATEVARDLLALADGRRAKRFSGGTVSGAEGGPPAGAPRLAAPESMKVPLR